MRVSLKLKITTYFQTVSVWYISLHCYKYDPSINEDIQRKEMDIHFKGLYSNSYSGELRLSVHFCYPFYHELLCTWTA
jgi:hypothetical protein